MVVVFTVTMNPNAIQVRVRLVKLEVEKMLIKYAVESAKFVVVSFLLVENVHKYGSVKKVRLSTIDS